MARPFLFSFETSGPLVLRLQVVQCGLVGGERGVTVGVDFRTCVCRLDMSPVRTLRCLDAAIDKSMYTIVGHVVGAYYVSMSLDVVAEQVCASIGNEAGPCMCRRAFFFLDFHARA